MTIAGLALGCSDPGEPGDDRPAPEVTPASTGAAALGLPTRPLVLLQPGGSQSAGPVQVGTAQLDLGVSTLAGGRLTVDRAVPGRVPAFDFPAFQATGAYPRAVIVARNAGNEDLLSPGAADFSYGADIRLDSLAQGRAEDNGDNVVQRGLATDPVMFKLEVDQRRPGCTVKSTAGAVSIFHTDTVEPDRWYRVRCERDGEGVTIQVTELPLEEGTTASGRTKRGPTGEVTMSGPHVPFSVGGKVAPDGTVVASASDQFNGSIANPYLAVEAGQ